MATRLTVLLNPFTFQFSSQILGRVRLPRNISKVRLVSNFCRRRAMEMNYRICDGYSTLPDKKAEHICKAIVDDNANNIRHGAKSESEENECPEYEKAVSHLNSLQSNAEVLKAMKSQNPYLLSSPESVLAEMLDYLQRGGLTITQLDSLKVIHVAGTKGKGSTCAFVESILRQFGLKTGFFSSPHLVSVRERIRINGKSLSKAEFAKYFFEVYERLQKFKKFDGDMPHYFRFLTCMAYYVFYHEKVDVAIMEVGIGGLRDSTNIVRKPVVVGITSLGLDHQSVLGNTLEEITLQKAGIMKPRAPAFTTSTQHSSSLNILKSYADQTKCPMFVSPPLDQYNNYDLVQLGIKGDVSQINASLALQLAESFMQQCFPEKLAESSCGWTPGTPFDLTKCHIDALQNCKWDGRFQTLKRNDNLIYYLDGAHTVESLSITKNWFLEKCPEDYTRVLVFHVTGDRSIEDHLLPLSTDTEGDQSFEYGIFCPLRVNSKASDNWSAIRADGSEERKCRAHADIWSKIIGNKNSLIFHSVSQVIEFLDILTSQDSPTVNGSTTKKCSVLVTGSLHLVGGFLSVLSS